MNNNEWKKRKIKNERKYIKYLLWWNRKVPFYVAPISIAMVQGERKQNRGN